MLNQQEGGLTGPSHVAMRQRMAVLVQRMLRRRASDRDVRREAVAAVRDRMPCLQLAVINGWIDAEVESFRTVCLPSP